ncbi:MAG: hypothetical protein HOP34_11030 [Methylococcaceae bacterium]|nr:hypothetical protein [Methylococcaceae bacterium]
MPSITLKAHYDGQRILLDEPFNLPVNAILMVTVLSDANNEKDSWHNIAINGLSDAYSDNEPDYLLESIKR